MSFRFASLMAIILAIVLVLPATVGHAAHTVNSPPPHILKASMKLLLVETSFIVANERKFMITSSTVIKDKEGKVISSDRLLPYRQVSIEYYFDRLSKDPIIVLIQQQ